MTLVKGIRAVQRPSGPLPAAGYKLLTVTSAQAETGSVGIFYRDNGVERLVRVLAGNVALAAGSRVFAWDKRDEAGNLVSNADQCYGKSRRHRITAKQVKTVGNTSTQLNGPAVWNNAHQARHLACTDTHGFPAVTYTEGTAASYLYFLLSDPNTRLKQHQQDSHSPTFVAVSGQEILRAGSYGEYDKATNHNIFHEFVTASRLSDLSDVKFEAGIAIGHYRVGPTYDGAETKQYSALSHSQVRVPDSVLDSVENPVNRFRISGLAAQKTGRLVFVARDLQDKVSVLDLSGDIGTTRGTWSVLRPRHLTLVTDNLLWLISGNEVVQYQLNADGTPVTDTKFPTAKAIGVIDPVALGLLADGTLVVMEGSSTHDPTTTGTHGLRGYNAMTGAALWTDLNAESYSTDPTIRPKKWFLANTKTFNKTNASEAAPFVCGQPDGKFWVGDTGTYLNYRYLANRELDPTLPKGWGWVGYNYSSGRDLTRPRRQFVNYLEYDADPATGEWTPVRNWAAGWRANYDDPYNRLFNVRTYNNERTYCMLQLQDRSQVQMQLVEMDSQRGLRYTGQMFPATTRLSADGHLYYLKALFPATGAAGVVGEVGTVTQLMQMKWTGGYAPAADGGHPTWAAATVYATSPVVTVGSAVTLGGFSTANMLTADGTAVFLSTDTKTSANPAARGGGWHLAGVPKGDTKYSWEGMPTTHRDYEGAFPLDGWTDGGNGVHNGLGFCAAEGDTIYTQYYGEFNKNAQDNMWDMHHQDGLPKKKFGAANDAGNPLGEAPNMLTSNTKTAAVYRFGNKARITQNDEGFSGGVLAIELDGFDTEVTDVHPLTDGVPPVLPGVALLPGLPPNQLLPSNESGISMSYSPTTEAMSVRTNLFTYGSQRDVSVKYRPYLPLEPSGELANPGAEEGTWNVAELPQNPAQTSWRIQGIMRFLLQGYSMGTDRADVEVLDSLGPNGKVIAAFGLHQNEINDCPLILNGQQIGTRSVKEWRNIINPGPELVLTGTGSGLTLRYDELTNEVSVPPVDADANMLHPKLLRVRFRTPAGRREFGVSFVAGEDAGALRFISNPAS